MMTKWVTKGKNLARIEVSAEMDKTWTIEGKENIYGWIYFSTRLRKSDESYHVFDTRLEALLELRRVASRTVYNIKSNLQDAESQLAKIAELIERVKQAESEEQ